MRLRTYHKGPDHLLPLFFCSASEKINNYYPEFLLYSKFQYYGLILMGSLVYTWSAVSTIVQMHSSISAKITRVSSSSFVVLWWIWSKNNQYSMHLFTDSLGNGIYYYYMIYIRGSDLHSRLIDRKVALKLNLCSLHDVHGCVFSNLLIEKIIYHNIHICDLFGLHELIWCVSSNSILSKMIYYKIHICNLCGLHELFECVSSKYALWRLIYHMSHICDLCGLHELFECVSSNFAL